MSAGSTIVKIGAVAAGVFILYNAYQAIERKIKRLELRNRLIANGFPLPPVNMDDNEYADIINSMTGNEQDIYKEANNQTLPYNYVPDYKNILAKYNLPS